MKISQRNEHHNNQHLPFLIFTDTLNSETGGGGPILKRLEKLIP